VKALLIVCLLAAPTKGRLVGYVLDVAGMPMPGARVIATAPGARHGTYSSEDGRFELRMRPGRYRVEIAAVNWLTAHQPEVRVPAGGEVELNAVLQPERIPEERIVLDCPSPWGPPPPSRPLVLLPLWPEGRVLIQEDGQRDQLLRASAHRLEGSVRGAPVDVEVQGPELSGRLAGEPVWIWLREREAWGHIGGHEVRFWLHRTPTGHLLRGEGVGHTLRFEESGGTLHWLPSCERPLERQAAGPGWETVYEGVCASGRRMRLTVTDELAKMPPFPRLILLALLLTEREEGRLFPRRR
jgi:hypothetical protein